MEKERLKGRIIKYIGKEEAERRKHGRKEGRKAIKIARI